MTWFKWLLLKWVAFLLHAALFCTLKLRLKAISLKMKLALYKVRHLKTHMGLQEIAIGIVIIQTRWLSGKSLWDMVGCQYLHESRGSVEKVFSGCSVLESKKPKFATQSVNEVLFYILGIDQKNKKTTVLSEPQRNGQPRSVVPTDGVEQSHEMSLERLF